MEKLLAMSFISAPMDFSGPAWVRARMASGRPSTAESSTPAADDKKAGARPTSSHCPLTRNTSCGGGRKEKHGDVGSRATPHFALEFDGLHCFETFVIH